MMSDLTQWSGNMQDQSSRWITCCIKYCEEPAIHNGLCVNHHRRNQKYGSPVATKIVAWARNRLSYAERFWLQVQKTDDDGCWLWQGSKDRDGYGVFKSEHEGIRYNKAHRFSYAINCSPVPSLMQICHRCDVPSCVRPDHLFLGTSAENQADKWAKGRGRAPFGETHNWAKLSEAEATAILNDPRPYVVLAAEYNVAPATIGSIKQRVSWPHLGPEKGAKAKRISPRRGKSDKGVTPEMVREIRASTERGVDLAARFGLKKQDITDIRKRRSWAHIP
jgi:hypothetical protein